MIQKIKLAFLFILLGTGLGVAQTSASASFTASVTIIQPIGITTTSQMNFANVDAQQGGAVVLSPDNTRSATGGVVLDDASQVSAAAFEITGEEDFTFSITLPQEEYVLSNGTEEMIIKDFTSNLANQGQLAGGATTVRVGATLNVNPNQKPGVYTSPGAMNVTVNYN